MKNKIKNSGKEYWRSLDQLADTPEYKQFLHREFPENASELDGMLSRRKFIALMGASLAFAGLASCRRPVEKIIPYVNAPENIVPGISKNYATTMPLGLSNYGLVVKSNEGRPTKIEGNEKHPSSFGKTNSIMQAAILGLYDPDRSSEVLYKQEKKDWEKFIAFWQNHKKELEQKKGEGFAILSDEISSPTFFRLYKKFKKEFPKANWFTYNPVSDENIYKGIELVAGKKLIPVYNFQNASVILSLDSDFLLTESENIVANLEFANGRKPDSPIKKMNRLYVAESTFSNTGSMADHRLKVASSHIPAFTLALINELKELGLKINLDVGKHKSLNNIFNKTWLNELAKDLIKNKSASLVVAGKKQPPLVHALVCLINSSLQNIEQTIIFKEITNSIVSNRDSLKELSTQIKNNKISTLAILNGNPVYNTPAEFNFKKLLKSVKYSIQFGAYNDETSRHTTWHLPAAHFLESWGDAESVNGSLSVIQPLIEPLFKGKSDLEFLTLLLTGKENKGYDLVRETWKNIFSDADFETSWRETLHSGVYEKNKTRYFTPRFGTKLLKKKLEDFNFIPQVNEKAMELVVLPSPAVYDGRFANNGWLQELPDSMTKLVWDNAAIMSPKTASVFNVQNEDVVEMKIGGNKIKLPVWILPGQMDFSISIYLGYGREHAGRIGTGVGFNAYSLMNLDSYYIQTGAYLERTGEKYLLAGTQDHGSMEGRPLIREATLNEFRKNPKFAKEMVEHPPLVSLWEEPSYKEGYQWGMAIDLNACTGCGVCSVACQSENNIPIIGKEHVRNGREMHWIRIDRYFTGEQDNPEAAFQPVACVHCENAPCEQVCPVAATSHDEEGLNVMTYNRCIGTRYCANNCPYKVRRFNFFNFTKDYPEVVKMAQNPDVTVRSRGVMEKCTYCTQRINSAKIKAKNEGRDVKDGEVQTACQQACPANAIVFGNINDPQSEISKVKKRNREYAMLGELNLKPRTTYMAKIRNPNPKLS